MAEKSLAVQDQTGGFSRPAAVSEELFLSLRALFESLIVRGKDFRAEFDKFDDAFKGEYQHLLCNVPRNCRGHVLVSSSISCSCLSFHTLTHLERFHSPI